MTRQTLKNSCDWAHGEGIFAKLTTEYEVPWAEDINGQTLDLDYYGNRSGNKLLNALPQALLDVNGKLTATATAQIADIITAKYLKDWEKVWATRTATYDPLNNYDMEEKETPAEYTRTTHPELVKVTETPAETTEEETPTEQKIIRTPAATTITDTPASQRTTHTPAETTVTETPAETKSETEGENGIAGFNSSEFSPDRNNSSSVTNTVQTAGSSVTVVNDDEVTENTILAAGSSVTTVQHAEEEDNEVTTPGTIVRTTQNPGTVEHEEEQAGSEIFEVNAERTLTRKGNIGVTTSQQMISSEYELRMKYNFFDSVVFPDVDKVLCTIFNNAIDFRDRVMLY